MPERTQVLRIETRKAFSAALARHVAGETRDPSADPERAGRTVRLGGDREAALAWLRNWRRHRPVGPPAKEAVEFVLAGPPPYGDPDAWDERKELAWARDSYAWLQDLLGPESLISDAALHRDETSPHVHVLAVPVLEGVLGWCRIRNAAVARLPDPGRPSRKYARLQDDYQEEVARRYGLGRGTPGSDRTHKPVDRRKAVDRQIERRKRQVLREECDLDMREEALRGHALNLEAYEGRIEERESDLRDRIHQLMELEAVRVITARERSLDELQAELDARNARLMGRIETLDRLEASLEDRERRALDISP